MVKPRLVVPLMAVLVLCASSGFATTFTYYNWELSEWQSSNNPYNPDVACLAHEYDWQESWELNGEHIYVLTGESPPCPDPDVSQNIRNRTQGKWTEWRVELTNATYVGGTATVYKQYEASPQWVIEPFFDGKGFLAHVVPGTNTQVDYYEQLYVFFSMTIDNPDQPVSIEEYPTDSYPIPEPCSIMGLLAGCVALGFRVRRRS